MEGVARYINETTKSMVLSHPEVEFHFLFDRPYDKQFIFADNVIPHIIGPPSRHPLLWYLWFERSLPSFFKKHNIDVFYSGDMYMSLRTDVPTLMVSHDLNYLHYPEGLRWSHLKFYQKYMPLYHKAADHLITVSEATKMDVIDKYGIDADMISVAYNSVPEGFSILDNPTIQDVKNKHTHGAPYFVYIGSLHPRKNVERLLLAYDLYRSNVTSAEVTKLVIFGRKAWKTGNIYKTYENLKYKEDVIFLSNEDVSVPEILGSATALCYISLFEGFGIPILEAYASGVPVITSNVSSMPEVAGQGALIVDPQSVPAIAQAMNTIINDQVLRGRLIENGQKQLSLFSWKNSAEIIFDKLELLAYRS